MKQLYLKTIIILVVIVFAGLFVVMFSTQNPQPSTSIMASSTNTVTSTSTVVQQAPQRIDGTKVPDGWYTHQTYGIDNEMTVLSRTKELPKTLDVEQISISDMMTSLSPEDFISRQGLVGGSLDSPGADWSWGIYKGHKTFSITVSANETSQWFVYVFGGQRVQEFTLTPNDKTNPNLEKDRVDFWKVISYYTQDSSFEKLSRTETQENCKTIALPPGQEPTIQAEPETGYVVAAFTKNSKKNYIFLNFNDDLSVCTPSVRELLSNTKARIGNKASTQ